MTNTAAANLTVTYTLTLTVTRAITSDYDDAYTPQEHAEFMVGAKATHELEKQVLQALRKDRRRIDGDFDVECVKQEVSEKENSFAMMVFR